MAEGEYAGSRQIIEAAAERFTVALGTGIRSVSEPAADTLEQIAWGGVTWLDLAATAALVPLIWIINSFLIRRVSKWILGKEEEESQTSWPRLILAAIRRPLYLALWVFGIYLAVRPVLAKLPSDPPHPLRIFFEKFFDLGMFVIVVWVFFRLISAFEVRMKQWASTTRSYLDDFLVPLATRTLQVVVPLIAVVMALPLLDMPEEYSMVLRRIMTLLIIGAVAWILVQAVIISERMVLKQFDIQLKDNLRARAIHTQVYVLKRTVLVLIGVFTVASVLMTFEDVRRIGASILASAGIAGIIIGFAAQRALANLFAGIQIAFTQPIRLDDVVIVEGEWGRIEEITLTYVVVKIWDLRRLVVPIGYFIEKPFQNWTRTSADILGAVTLQVDYTLPIDELRPVVQQFVENAKDWDRKFWNLQVTDAHERTMTIRVLATAEDAGLAWNLRCEIREKLIGHIQRHYPHCLPRVRAQLDGGESRMPQAGDETNPA